uniref:phosphoglycerate mutase n=1 Tax=Streptococcus orisratti TaxID=114652 RepID=UPI002943CED3
PNFQTEQNTILFNKLNGELFEVTEVYYDFIDSLRIGTDFQKLFLRKYNVNKEEGFEIKNTILKNLISLGVVINE